MGQRGRGHCEIKMVSLFFTFGCFGASGFGRFALQFDLIVFDGRADEIFQGAVIYFVALEKIDGSPLVASEAGVEELAGIREVCAVGKGDLHFIFVGVGDGEHAVF